MLIARATGEVARLVAADAILGIPYTIEELEDGDQLADETPPPPEPPARRTAQRRTVRALPAPAPEDEPPADEERPPTPTAATEDDPATGDDPPATDKQRRAILAICQQVGLANRDDRLAFIGSTLGRPVATSKDLTVAEASRVIDALNALQDEGRSFK
jgi:hypothetical protein